MNELKAALQLFKKFEYDKNLLVEASERRRFVVRSEPHWELVLIAWGRGTVSEIHDHSGSRCWTRVLKGEIEERIIDQVTLDLVGVSMLDPYTSYYIDDERGAHQLKNISNTTSFSVHLYTDPIKASRVLDEKTGLWFLKLVESEPYLKGEALEKFSTL